MLSGCKGALKSSYDNFTAYYNTFYNAKQYYKDGYNDVVKQRSKINPERPIILFEQPVKISESNFDQAISKSADVLRNHPKSKWVDNALFLIGRSYFYELKFYSADQKFKELYNATQSDVMQQKSVLWQGRVALQMDHYDDGINLLSRELSSNDHKWNKWVKARTQLVEAELYVQKKDWGSAEKLLAEAIPYIKGKEIKARAYFLQGQLQERLGNLQKAFNSYAHVHDTNPEYDLVFNALRKQAEVARKQGRLRLALQIFTNMSNDDKNFDILPELKYEIARTMEAMGEYKRAQIAYHNILRNNLKSPTRATKAKIYYGLGNIYRDFYKNLSVAAAYYDSSASEISDTQKLPEGFNASELSKSFGEYAKLKKEVSNMDSLLWLGGLPKNKLDSVVNVIRKRKIEAFKAKMRAQKSSNNTMVNVGAARQEQNNSKSDNGFLNYENPHLVAEASQAFKAIWGNRPLVDNWRRIQAIRQSAGTTATRNDEEITNNHSAENIESKITVDLSKVPLTNDAKEKMREEIAKREYEIGNVFFLSLNVPDSAKKYYDRIIHHYHETDLTSQAMYSLSELYYVQGDSTKAQQWADSVITGYPSSIYALRLNKRYGKQVSEQMEKTALESTLQDSLETLYYSILDSVRSLPPVKSAEKLRSFGLNHTVSGYAPDALLGAAKQYADAAKEQSNYDSKLQQWITIHQQWRQKQQHLEQLKDSAKVHLKNSKISQAEQKKWKAVLDSSLSKPDMQSYFPYNGSYWDSTRVVLHQLMNYFPNYDRKSEVESILQEISKPEQPKSKAKKRK